MGIKIQAVAVLTIIITFPIKKNKKTKTFEKSTAKEASTEFKSLDNLFNILPNGTLSKN